MILLMHFQLPHTFLAIKEDIDYLLVSVVTILTYHDPVQACVAILTLSIDIYTHLNQLSHRLNMLLNASNE